jgi:hypothetical protein
VKFLKDFGAIVAIIVAALGAAVAYGTLSSTVTAHSARLDKAEPAIQQNTTDAAVLKSNVETIKQSLERIEDHLGTKR